MPSVVDRLKRAFVSVLLRLAAAYGLDLRVTRESSDAEVRGAYRKLSRRTHPDRGGQTTHQTELNTANEAWEDAVRAARSTTLTLSPDEVHRELRVTPIVFMHRHYKSSLNPLKVTSREGGGARQQIKLA